jgi:UDPglucose--hexose-1-phosphate uridylyltransferase
MEIPEITKVIDVWVDQYRSLASVPWVTYVQIFENRGEAMGCSNPHPHCQIWASENLPNETSKELSSFRRYSRRQDGCLLCRYLELEESEQSRLVVGNEDFVAIVPFWAVWPFETIVCSRRHHQSLDQLNEKEKKGLADLLKRLTCRYDNLFATPFPYSMGFHQKPTDKEEHSEWHLHAHFYPPLLRSASVRKFMVGYEMLATPQRDITPEAAAERLRNSSEKHFTLA